MCVSKLFYIKIKYWFKYKLKKLLYFLGIDTLDLFFNEKFIIFIYFRVTFYVIILRSRDHHSPSRHLGSFDAVPCSRVGDVVYYKVSIVLLYYDILSFGVLLMLYWHI